MFEGKGESNPGFFGFFEDVFFSLQELKGGAEKGVHHGARGDSDSFDADVGGMLGCAFVLELCPH